MTGGQVEPSSILLPPTVSVEIPIATAPDVAHHEELH
jgi:hypothetical protein